MAADFGRRFEELCKQAEVIDSSKRLQRTQFMEGTYIDSDRFLQWQVNVRHLLASACGSESEHLKIFSANEKPTGMSTNYDVFRRLRAVLLAAKDDYERGYLYKIRSLIQAEVFDSELEQASELLESGYVIASAVVAGVVLETKLRQMCEDSGLSPGKLDKMNADLAKAGTYNKLVQKQITAWADIRNNAAHGQAGEFQRDDVIAMIRDLQRFLAGNMA